MRTISLALFVVFSCISCTTTAFVAKPSFARQIYRVQTKVRGTSENHGLDQVQVKSTIENNDIFNTQQYPYDPIGRRKWLRGMILAPVLKSIAAHADVSSPSTVTVDRAVPKLAICDPTVESYRKGSKVIHIIGTAHISSLSAALSKEVVRETRVSSRIR